MAHHAGCSTPPCWSPRETRSQHPPLWVRHAAFARHCGGDDLPREALFTPCLPVHWKRGWNGRRPVFCVERIFDRGPNPEASRPRQVNKHPTVLQAQGLSNSASSPSRLLLYVTIPIWREQPKLPAIWKFLTFTANLVMVYPAERAFSQCVVSMHRRTVLPLASHHRHCVCSKTKRTANDVANHRLIWHGHADPKLGTLPCHPGSRNQRRGS